MKFPVSGATLNVEIDGPEIAPALLLWHGAGCTLRMWDQVVPQLAERFRCVRFDARGAGRSSETEDPDSQYTFEQYALDANALLDSIGAEQCHVWSMAWGSRAALAYCSLYPQRVLSAAFFDASIGQADVAAQKEGGRAAMQKQDAAGIKRFARPDGWNTHDHPDAVAQSLAAAGKFDLPAAVGRLTMPVLVATGDHDPNLESSRTLVDLAPDARLVVMENVGHGSVLQRPDLTTEVFLDFHQTLAQKAD
jgi:pimeloyl-ACP methyl ester carboxylesterase